MEFKFKARHSFTQNLIDVSSNIGDLPNGSGVSCLEVLYANDTHPDVSTVRYSFNNDNKWYITNEIPFVKNDTWSKKDESGMTTIIITENNLHRILDNASDMYKLIDTLKSENKLKQIIIKADVDTKRALLLISAYINNPCRIGKLDMDVISYTTDDRQKTIVHSIILTYKQVVVMKATVTTSTVSIVVDYTWLKDGKWQEDFIESMKFYPISLPRKFSIEEELKTLNGYQYE